VHEVPSGQAMQPQSAAMFAMKNAAASRFKPRIAVTRCCTSPNRVS
jgi:hypothetical protein